MAHELDTKDDGSEAMFFVKRTERDVPWHRLGLAVSDALTAHDAMVAAGLDRTLSKRQLAYKDSAGQWKEMSGYYAVARDDNDMVTAEFVSDDYALWQPSECFAFFDAIVDDGSAKYETAGSVREGRQIFLTSFLPDHVTMVGGNDEVQHYLAMVQSYDRASSLHVMVTDVRIVCQNTVNLALSNFKSKFSIRHDSKFDVKVEEARKALNLTFKYLEEFDVIAERWINEEFKKRDMEKVAANLYPGKDQDDQRARDRQFALIGAFESSDAIADGWRHTKWGAWNAITEHIDWLTPVSGSRETDETKRAVLTAEKQLQRTWFGVGAGLREKAFELLNSYN